jgi:collagen type VII alpha
MDSLIRLRQINKPELSGYISQVTFPALRTSGINVGGSIVPTGSGIYSLGSSSFPFNQVYAREVIIPSGSGIWFGPNFFTAYTSGSDIVLKLNTVTITSSPTGLSIIGPSGAQGPIGATGPTGASGIGITGYAALSTTGLRFLFSNGTSGTAISLPSGAIGATGISLTGFNQSGNFLRPLFSNGTTGTSFTVPSGATGRQGRLGGIKFDISDFSGFSGASMSPRAYIYDIDNNGVTSNPTLYLVRGMSYDFGYSGLNLSTVNIGGNNYQTNYFIESGITGYLKFVFFDPTITNLYGNPKTGRYIRQEISTGIYSDILAKVLTTEAVYNLDEDATRSAQSFSIKLSSASSYKYGFQKYNFATQIPIDNLGAWGFYVLGDASLSYFGPTGPSGAQGVQGIPGTQGERGFRGTDGAAGTSIVSIQRSSNDIRFLLSDGTYTDYITLPAGGPSGAQGLQGDIGPSGTQGPIGPQGATGFADRYATSFFYYDTNYNGTGAVFNKRVSGSSTWNLVSGTGRRFSPGDEISFYNNGLVGKAYTTWQKLLFADSPYTRSQYFYGTVTSFNTSNGLISFLVSDSPQPLGMVSNQVQWDAYNLIDVNLGGLGSSGAMGISGAQGQQGPRGDTGNPLFTINNPISGLIRGTNTLRFNQYDAWNLYVTGNGNTISFDYTAFTTGQTVLLRVYNSGDSNNVDLGPTKVLNWDAEVKFPYGVQAPSPNPGQSSLYTFVRFPDAASTKIIFCTYSVSYSI